jgi:hypothetical protein
VQDLTVSIASHHPVETCILIQDEQNRSSINREAFFDQQEWNLYQHVAIELRQTNEEYSFDTDNTGQLLKKHSVLAVTCRAGDSRNKHTFYVMFVFTFFSSSVNRI